MDFLLLAAEQNTPIEYLPVVIQFLVAAGFVVVTMFATHLLGPKRKTQDKLVNFESGIPIIGNARQPMAIKYFLVAILLCFLMSRLFSFYPYAVNFRELGQEGFLAVVMFVGFFLTGFIYILKKGALDWED